MYTIGIFLYVRRSVGFTWSREVLRLLAVSTVLTVLVFSAIALLPAHFSLAAGGITAVIAAVYSLCGLTQRLGNEHPLSRITELLRRFLNLA
jgi:hypothetical protein